MTREEAAERILSGSAWLVCTVCEGKGNTTTDTDANTLLINICGPCLGFGTIEDSLYVEACHLLDKPMPKRATQMFFNDGTTPGAFTISAWFKGH